MTNGGRNIAPTIPREMKNSRRGLVALLNACIPLCHATTFMVDGSELWIQDGVLESVEIDRIASIVRRHAGIDTIHLKDLTGGNSLQARIDLHSVFVFRRVEVHGLCESACAHIALTSRLLALHLGSTLAIHDAPPFIDWAPLASVRRKDVEWLRVRLPTIPKIVIEQLLLAPWPRQRQLILRPLRHAPGFIDVAYCDPAPERCFQLDTIAPGESQVVVYAP